MLSQSLQCYLAFIDTDYEPKGVKQCMQYANNVLQQIKEDHAHVQNTLDEFIRNIDCQKKDIIMALNALKKSELIL